MNAEPQLAPKPEPSFPALSIEDLWKGSAAFRKLAICAGLLTTLAVVAPILLPYPGRCTLQLDRVPLHLPGQVTGFAPEDWTITAIAMIEAELGAKISPGYRSLKRVILAHPGQSTPFTTAAVPATIEPNIGDLVELNSRYRDPDLPCHVVPWTVNRVLGSSAH